MSEPASGYPPISFGDGSKDHGLGKCPTCGVFLTGGVSNAYVPPRRNPDGTVTRFFGGDQSIFCPKCLRAVHAKRTHGERLDGYEPPAWWPGPKPA